MSLSAPSHEKVDDVHSDCGDDWEKRPAACALSPVVVVVMVVVLALFFFSSYSDPLSTRLVATTLLGAARAPSVPVVGGGFSLTIVVVLVVLLLLSLGEGDDDEDGEKESSPASRFLDDVDACLLTATSPAGCTSTGVCDRVVAMDSVMRGTSDGDGASNVGGGPGGAHDRTGRFSDDDDGVSMDCGGGAVRIVLYGPTPPPPGTACFSCSYMLLDPSRVLATLGRLPPAAEAYIYGTTGTATACPNSTILLPPLVDPRAGGGARGAGGGAAVAVAANVELARHDFHVERHESRPNDVVNGPARMSSASELLVVVIMVMRPSSACLLFLPPLTSGLRPVAADRKERHVERHEAWPKDEVQGCWRRPLVAGVSGIGGTGMLALALALTLALTLTLL